MTQVSRDDEMDGRTGHAQDQINLAEHAARRAVAETLIAMGIDANDPLKMQRQFQGLARLAEMLEDSEFGADLEFVRRIRTAKALISDSAMRTVVRVVVLFILGVIALGFKDWVASHVGTWLPK